MRTTVSALIILSVTLVLVPAADISLGTLAFTAQPENLQIPLHIASQTELQSKVVIVTFDDTTVFRETGFYENGTPHYPGGFLFNLASAVPLMRLHPEGNEDLGIGFDVRWMVPFMTMENWVAMSMEFIIDLGITISPVEGLAVGVSRKHICSHLLDRALFTSGDGFLGIAPSDVDPQHGPMAIRDSVIFSAHFAPEKVLGLAHENFESSLYIDYAYSLPGWDPLEDARYTRPSYRTSQYYQYGAQANLYLRNELVDIGGIYAACNFSFYANSGYTQNTGYSIGYILPFSIGGRTFRIDYSFYDGRAVNEEHYGHRERYTTMGLLLQ